MILSLFRMLSVLLVQQRSLAVFPLLMTVCLVLPSVAFASATPVQSNTNTSSKSLLKPLADAPLLSANASPTSSAAAAPDKQMNLLKPEANKATLPVLPENKGVASQQCLEADEVLLRQQQHERNVSLFLSHRPERVELDGANKQHFVLQSVYNETLKRSALYINNQEVFRFSSSIGFLTPYLRSKQVAHRLSVVLRNPISAQDVTVRQESAGLYSVLLGSSILTYADEATAHEFGLSSEALAQGWAKQLKIALGEKKPVAHPQWKQSKAIEGLASWYGPGFHGRRAADGSVFNQYALTAAHKTLPFGTLVKVTHKGTGKSCVVKITDRGPFHGNRVIDLSKGAASVIGLLSSGVAHVSLEVLRR